MPLITRWLEEDELGMALRRRELDFCRRLLRAKSGEVLLSLGPVDILPMPELSAFPVRLKIAPALPADIVAAPEALPFAEASADAILAVHAVEYSPDWQQLLREAARVLKPEGILLLCVFNPHRLWLTDPLWQGKKIIRKKQCPPPAAITRLLRQQSLTVSAAEYLFYEPFLAAKLPKRQVRALELAANRWWPHLGKVYALAAVKRVLPPPDPAEIAFNLKAVPAAA